jgi:lycopene cyclase domain-containing protein
VKAEYLLFNLLILAGPLIMSFEKQIRFAGQWRYAWPAIVLVAIPYIIWDALVTGSHWWFNEKYTLDFRLAKLPIEEWLFFFSVPFAALFSWEVIKFHYRRDRKLHFMRRVRYGLYALQLAGLIFFANGKEYTGLMLIFLGAAFISDRVLRTNLFLRRRFFIYLAVVIGFIFIFNGYLTWRPVVLYGEAYQLGWRLGTIPIEDFGYGMSLIFLVTVFYEKFKKLWPANY